MSVVERRAGHVVSGWVLALLAATVGLAGNATADPNAPYTDFLAMSVPDLATLQVKLTYVGPGDESVPSVLFTSDANMPDITVFTPFRRDDVPYFNDDDVSPSTFLATTSELKGVIDSVGTAAAVTAGDVTEPMIVSFALYNSVGGDKVFESIVDQAQAIDLFAALRRALSGNPGLMIVEELACMVAAIDPARPTDESGQVSVSLSGMRLDHETGRFVSRATVTNGGASAVDGPVTLVFDHQAPGFRLANRTGTTCGLSPTGRDYLNILGSGESLDAGSALQVTLEFDDPERLLIRTAISVFAGPGSR